MDLNLIRAIAAVATTIGVLIAVYQFWRTKQQAILSFEDEIAREYREITRKIPVEAMLGKNVKQEDKNIAMNEIYTYIDLCNEQIFLRQKNRIRKDTWNNWVEGIEANLRLPEFQSVWCQIKQSLPNLYSELRRLEEEDFSTDPKEWKKE